MIGQEKLRNRIASFDVTTFPRSILLLGEEGCGKKTLLKEVISPLLFADIKDISDDISFDYLLSILISTDNIIYMIDVDKITSAKQNAILKFLEEPPENSYIALISSKKQNILSTILNRCYIFNFDSYSDSELLTFTENEELLKVFRTPGKLLSARNVNFQQLKSLCEKIFTQNKRASASNLLTVASKIDWDNKNSELYSVSIFYDILLKSCVSLCKNKKINLSAYRLTESHVNDALSEIRFDRKRFFEKYLLELKYGVNE